MAPPPRAANATSAMIRKGRVRFNIGSDEAKKLSSLSNARRVQG
jgi:hypothetical protein